MNGENERNMDLDYLESIPPWSWPEDADDVLLRVLRDDKASADDRLRAAGLAGDSVVINDALAEALQSILCDDGEPEELRATASISFGPALEQADIDAFEDPDDVPISEEMFHRIRETLRQRYADADVPKLVRRRILEASVRAQAPWHEDAIRAAYASEDEDWRLTAVFCMQYVRGFDEQILESLDSDNPDIEYEAVCAAGNWEVDAAWPRVAALLRLPDTDKPLLLAAIEAAALIRPQAAGEVLGELLDSYDEDISDAAHEALAMAEGPWSENGDDLEP